MSLISRMKSDMNPVLLSDIQKRYRWEANKNKATIGYVQNANGENVGTGSYIDEMVILRISILKQKLD